MMDSQWEGTLLVKMVEQVLATLPPPTTTSASRLKDRTAVTESRLQSG